MVQLPTIKASYNSQQGDKENLVALYIKVNDLSLLEPQTWFRFVGAV